MGQAVAHPLPHISYGLHSHGLYSYGLYSDGLQDFGSWDRHTHTCILIMAITNALL